MISLLHRQLLSTNVEWRTAPVRRSVPALADPLPVTFGRVRVSPNARVHHSQQIAQLRPTQLPPGRCTLPALANPIPVSFGRMRVSPNARVYRSRRIAQLRPTQLPPVPLIDLHHPRL